MRTLGSCLIYYTTSSGAQRAHSATYIYTKSVFESLELGNFIYTYLYTNTEYLKSYQKIYYFSAIGSVQNGLLGDINRKTITESLLTFPSSVW